MQSEKRLLETLDRKTSFPPPLWMMRQAGRYLPEYREVRTSAGSFWKMCTTPELAAEVTLQPIRRFGFDTAIVFSDILVVPFALGIPVSFEEGNGPKLSPVSDAGALERSQHDVEQKLAFVYEALALAREMLGPSIALLGFAGAPWTLASYMAAGAGGDEQKAARLWAYRDPEGFEALIDVLVESVSGHLIRQLAAGADAVQIFDSWASGLPPEQFARWVIEPTKRIVANIRAANPYAKIIGFPRGATLEGYELYVRETRVDAVSLGTAVPIDWAVDRLGTKAALQGNLDPLALVAGGRVLADGVERILAATHDVPFIFNLGHGILPETPIEHVEELVRLVRGGR